jgi:Rad3-related DNA helicase
MWSLNDEKGELKPKVFSNGKSQEEVVREIVKEIKSGQKIIFLHGKCGTGKSAISLNIAKELGKASIVVPIKNLQRQYETDYMDKKFVLKNSKEKLKIAVLTGRKNHKCKYLHEKESPITSKQEKDSNLFNIFKKEVVAEDKSCDSNIIPCKLSIRPKNELLIKRYYKENPEHENKNLIPKFIKRLSIAPACPYWSPIYNSDVNIKLKSEKKTYKSLAGEHSIYIRKEGCEYYNQFLAYKEADVILFNSESYMLETAIGRKPATEVEIIDECDEFLDNFALEETINLTRLKNELSNFKTEDKKDKEIIDEITTEASLSILESEERIYEDILLMKDSKLFDLIKSLSANPIEEIIGDEESYIERSSEISRKFYEVLEECYISFYKDKIKKDLFVRIVTINLDKKLKELISKNKALVFMSGTLHSQRVLKDIFGLENFKIIDAEIINQGGITKTKTGLEKDFRFENFSKGIVTRKDYLKALDRCIETAKKPAVVQVSAFQDLPSEQEIKDMGLLNLMSYSTLMEAQEKDKEGNNIKEFKKGKMPVLFTTKCSRGIDFPFEMCNSVVITKFPYPNTQSLFWKILKKQKPAMFWEFYKDKAHRELLQRVYRSVRDPADHVFLLSPDIRVLETNLFDEQNKKL